MSKNIITNDFSRFLTAYWKNKLKKRGNKYLPKPQRRKSDK